MTIGYRAHADFVENGTKIHTMRSEGSMNRMPKQGVYAKEFRILSTYPSYRRCLIRADRKVVSVQSIKMKIDWQSVLHIWVDGRLLNYLERESFVWHEGFRYEQGSDYAAFCLFYGLRYPGNFWHGHLLQFTEFKY